MNLDAKEKAEQLFYKFYLIKDEVYDECRMHENEAKQCALIAVDEMIKILPYGYRKTKPQLTLSATFFANALLQGEANSNFL